MKTSNNAYEQLRSFLEQGFAFSDHDWENFKNLWHPKSAGRKELVSDRGNIEKYLYFVVSGVQRIYSLDSQGREATVVFTYAPSFGGILDSLMLQKPSNYSFETLTKSEFLKISHHDFIHWINNNSHLKNVVINGLSETISGLMLRMVELQTFSSEEKFKALLKRSPHILQLVPHKYLANYLGIDPTNFSKLINSVKF